jgi:site-specific DNA recombinase
MCVCELSGSVWITVLDVADLYATITFEVINPANTPNCITYARVSTEKQADKELSIPAQVQAMREYAQRQGWVVLEEFTEPGASGRTAERPVLKKLLARCRTQPQVDVVLVHKIDRLCRNVYDHATIRALLKQRSIRLASVVENMDDSITGQLVENIMASIADFYSANLGEEVKKGMTAKIRRGEWPHLPAVGYHQVKGPDGRSHVEPDPIKAPLVQQAFALYATGYYSLRHVAAELGGKGLLSSLGRPLSASYLQVLLRNPFYVGRLLWKGDVYPGKHEPLVPIELFNEVQRQLASKFLRGGVRYGSLEFWLKGIAHCGECGSKMTAERHGRWTYYRCLANTRSRNLCRARFSNAERVHDKLRAVYKMLSLSEDAVGRLLATTEQRVREVADSRRSSQRSLVMMRKRMEEKRSRADEALAVGDMPRDRYLGLTAKWTRELHGLDEQLEALKQDPDVLMTTIRSRVQAAGSLWDFQLGLEKTQRHRLATAILARVDLKGGTITSIDLRGPFELRHDSNYQADVVGPHITFTATDLPLDVLMPDFVTTHGLATTR